MNKALTQYECADKTLLLEQQRAAKLQTVVEKTQKLMTHGQANYLEVITAQQNLLQAQLNEVDDKYDMIQAIINLYHALGGSVR